MKDGTPPDWRLSPPDEELLEFETEEACWFCGEFDVLVDGAELVCVNCGNCRPREGDE